MCLFFIYPIDYIFTRLAADLKSNGEHQYNGSVDVYKKTVATDGICGLYRGFSVSCLGIFVYRACYFGIYNFKSIIIGNRATFGATFAFGLGTAIISGLVTYPLDTVRRRMMVASGKSIGPIDCLTQILKNEGFMALMKGAGLNILKTTFNIILIVALDNILKHKFGL